jgi:hypothetical protein
VIICHLHLTSSKSISTVGIDCELLVLALWVGNVLAYVVLLQKELFRGTDSVVLDVIKIPYLTS